MCSIFFIYSTFIFDIAFFFSDCCRWNLEGYIHIDSDVSGNRYSNSLPGLEDDADIRLYNVLFVFCLPCTGHHIRIFEQPLFWIAEKSCLSEGESVGYTLIKIEAGQLL